MKLALPLLGVITTLALFSGQSALATPVPFPMQSGGVTPQTLSECQQDCLDAYRDNLKKNRKVAWICTFSFLGVCLAGHYQEDVLGKLDQAAADIHEDCLDECEPPTPQP